MIQSHFTIKKEIDPHTMGEKFENPAIVNSEIMHHQIQNNPQSYTSQVP